MGQSRSLVIAISVPIVGIAILAAVGFFRSGDVEANKKAMINDVNQIAHLAVRYYSRPIGLCGGGHNYTGFVVLTKFETDLNGTYTAMVLGPTILRITPKDLSVLRRHSTQFKMCVWVGVEEVALGVFF